MINLNDLQWVPLTKVFMSIIPPNYSFVTIEKIWNKWRNPMQLTQRKRKNTTVISEEKAESAFAPTPEKPTRLYLLDKLIFPEPKAQSDLGLILEKSSWLFLLTWVFNFLFVLSFELLFGPCILIHIILLLFVVLSYYILRIFIH